MSVSELEELLFFQNADTLAFIDPPSYKRAWALQPSSVQSIGHRIHSWKLLETGSPVFQQLFEQRMQERNIKRRGELPEGIKYIIDLTPPSTEEDAVLFLTELSCPLGIRTWPVSKTRQNIPKPHVSCKNKSPLQGEVQNNSDVIPEYSPSRHRAGIVHILQVLEGLRPSLDTPCKLWTFFALAKLYEIATIPQVRTRVMSWAYEPNNRSFIELHPEISYRIGKGILCDHLLRDSFSVLVGEEALLLHCSDSMGPDRKQKTVHGRPKESLDDDDLQRVQYAGRSFLDHVIGCFIELAGTEMHWLTESAMFRRVLFFRPKDQVEFEIVGELISSLKDYVRGSIVGVLAQSSTTWLPQKYTFESSGIYPTQGLLNAYGFLSWPERILTRTFWQHLIKKTFAQTDCEHTDPRVLSCATIANLGNYIGAFRDQQNAVIRLVTASELNRKANEFNCLRNPGYLGSPTDVVQSGYASMSGETPYAYGVDNGYFSVTAFVDEAQYHVTSFARGIVGANRPEMTYELTDSLTCVTETEFKYLPLWAGGCDDGTGGVYADLDIPFAETGGFSGPGPFIHTGSTIPSHLPSVISTLDSTVHGAFHRATEGYDSEVVSINSGAIAEAGNMSTADSTDFQNVEDELSLALDSSAEDIDNMSFDTDSDSDDTVVIGDHDHLSEFEDLKLDDDSGVSLSNEKGH